MTRDLRARVTVDQIMEAPGFSWARLWLGDVLLRFSSVPDGAGDEHPAIARANEDAARINEMIDERVAELLAANNAEVERRRTAEAEARRPELAHAAAWQFAADNFQHYERIWRHELQLQAQQNRRLCEAVATGYRQQAEPPDPESGG